MSSSVISAVLVTIICATLWNQVECLPTGAPAGACTTLTPAIQSHIDPPQPSPVPYEVDLLSLNNGDSYSYIPGETYTVSLLSTEGRLFRGVLLQGRTVADGSPAGTFEASDPLLRLSDCNTPQISVTHNSRVDKSIVTANWTAPPAGTGSVQIGFAVVEVLQIYWADQMSEVILESTCPEDETSGEYSIGGSFILAWPSSGLGESSIFCPCENSFSSLMASRRCRLNSLHLAAWDVANISFCEDLNVNFCIDSELSPIELSEQLLSALSTNVVASAVNVVQVSEVIFILAMATGDHVELIDNFLDIVNEFLNIDRDLVLGGQILGNASARVIESIELFASLVPLNNQTQENMFTRKNFAVFIMEPIRGPNGSFQGLLVEAGSGLDINDVIDFTQGIFRVTGSNTTQMSLASVFITQELLEIFQSNTPNEPTRLIFIAYNIKNPHFQDPSRDDIKGSIVLSVLQSQLQSTMPPTDLVEPVVFQYQINEVVNLTNGSSDCVFWNFTMNDAIGAWSSEGCFPDMDRSTNTTIVCLCDHLTNFAVLLDVTPNPNDGLVGKFQRILSYIGGIISTIFLTATVITYISVRKLRSNKYRQILIQMCLSLIGLYISFTLSSLWGLFYDDASLDARKQVCITFSALVQYFLLVYFCITVAQSILLYVKLVIVLGTKNMLHQFLLRAGLLGWSLPLVIVAALLGPTHDDYLREETMGMEMRATCFPRRWPLYAGVIIPFGIAYLLNIVVFIIVATVVLRRKENVTHRRKKLRKAFSVILLAVMFGIGWVFGILGLDDNSAISTIFQFLFIAIVGFQGFCIFLLYPCRNKDARDLWKKLFHHCTCCSISRCHNEQKRASIRNSHDQPRKGSSSPPSRFLMTLDNPQPSTNDVSAYVDAEILPPSRDDQHTEYKQILQASALDPMKEEPTTNNILLHPQIQQETILASSRESRATV